MILVDTSAWVEFLRGTGHPSHLTLKHHLARRSPVATTEVVVMELLAGCRTDRERDGLRTRLTEFPLLALRGLGDFETAAEMYRACRRAGVTVRKLIDCLIASVAIREGASVLHNDSDFERLALHTRLRTEPYQRKP